MFQPVFKFRESRPIGQVILFKDGSEVFRSPEYRITAEHAKTVYGLSDAMLMEMYRDYREDYESI